MKGGNTMRIIDKFTQSELEEIISKCDSCEEFAEN